MGNILDYLDWRGDLTLQRSPFNEVDNLILAELAFVDFTGIVPPPGQGTGIALHAAAERFFQKEKGKKEPADMGILVPASIPVMLEKMARSARFRDMKLACYVDQLDPEKAEQFAAVSVETGDGSVYLSFRGTDDSIAGWKEDFLLGCLPEIPAQKKAVSYVRVVAGQYPRRRLILGGHSKGGNLAVFGAVFCPQRIQKRIAAVYSNDGPGFHEKVLALPEHERIESRIHSIVPKSSVVGMLLEHEEAYAVVDSTQLGLLQHDGFSWQVLGDRFLTLKEITRQGQMTDLKLSKWIMSMTPRQREQFVDALFRVLSASGAESLTDLRTDRVKAVSAMVRAMKDMDKDTRDALFNFVGLLFRSNLRLILEGIQEDTEKKLTEKSPGRRWTLKKKREEEQK